MIEEVVIDGEVCLRVELSQDKWALVDVADRCKVEGFKWCASASTVEGTWYAQRNAKKGEASGIIKMHRVIAEAEDGEDVDHKNHDGLDNRRKNLRPCTRSQNCANGIKRSDRLPRGVKRIGKKFGAYLSKHPKAEYLGLFENPADAARAYDVAAAAAYGEFATLNHQ